MTLPTSTRRHHHSPLRSDNKYIVGRPDFRRSTPDYPSWPSVTGTAATDRGGVMVVSLSSTAPHFGLVVAGQHIGEGAQSTLWGGHYIFSRKLGQNARILRDICPKN